MDPMAYALGVTALLGITAILIFNVVRADWRAERIACICHHIKKRHVSALDWDSDYGNPSHTNVPGTVDYVKPGTCRECRCQYYIADYRAKP